MSFGRMIAFAFAAAAGVTASTAGPVETAQPAIVMVEVKGTDIHSAPVTVRGTGFFIDRDGYLLTSNHLIDDAVELGADRKQLSFDIVLDPTTQPNPIHASFGWSDSTADLLVLATPLADRNLTILKPTNRDQTAIEVTDTPIYTAGHPGGDRYTGD